MSSFDDEKYTIENLMQDLDMLRKAGFIEIVGITDDGDWLYGPTQHGIKVMKEFEGMDPDRVNDIFSTIVDLAAKEDE